ncbi:MAG: sulfite oxidase heme-binding subunit YedZ [Longimicrobiales bacterium]
MRQKRAVLALKTLLWIGALAPGAYLVSEFLTGSLGANPVEKLTRWTGMTALVLLITSLAVSPARRLTGWNPLIKLRRPLGLFAFFYAGIHFVIWFAFYNVFDLSYMWADIIERRFVTAGMAAFVVMLPLAATSTQWAIRKLKKRWGLLHRGAYLAGILGVVHYFWLVKADTRLPWVFAVVLAALLAFRLPQLQRTKP